MKIKNPNDNINKIKSDIDSIKKDVATIKNSSAGIKHKKIVLIVLFCAFCILLSMCRGGNQSKNEAPKEDTNASQQVQQERDRKEEVAKEQKEKAEKEKAEAIDYGQLFIDTYNSSCRTEPLQVVESFVPHEKGNSEEGFNHHYRTEFRLPAYRDTLGLACSIGDYLGTSSRIFKSVDVVYWPDKPHYRVYVLDNSGTFATDFIDLIKVLHPDAFSDEFLSEFEDAVSNGTDINSLNNMIKDENFDMYGQVYVEDKSSGFVEGSIKVDK